MSGFGKDASTPLREASELEFQVKMEPPEVKVGPITTGKPIVKVDQSSLGVLGQLIGEPKTIAFPSRTTTDEIRISPDG
jgi:hypothetical protein